MITTRQRAGLFAALVLMAAGGTANAQGDTSMLKFAERENCMSCHSVSRTFMGPSFHSIAAKYANVEGAHRQLARKIAEGGVGVWGQVPMPANTQLTPSQALALADWILSLH
ncbi:Cytochrome c551/c552 [Caballeronia glathei]|jgi:cytochrome c|uniref:Cytochrome C n=1 Tax=Caballeronia glathei TaxID=60547 RepID=A0A069PV05_9BURK|nr:MULTISPECIES: c-type cytochrome [Burkholderiaceae]KDR44400.1 cytochrome C [Caballeronia glathei]TCK44498.1 cytochrome c [Paraburkholderia sp. BL8N3]CDY74128.1 Cytochrome c551/c552 [Caballeronia glathei]